METINYIIAAMLFAIIAYLFWHAYVTNRHGQMTPQQINASGNYFKKVLPLINILQILNRFRILTKKKGNSS